jgi:hypothetical protein
VQHHRDGRRDREPDQRVGEPPAESCPARAEQHGKRGEPVGAGMQPVGDEGGRADSAAGADTRPGHPLVAREADQTGRGHRPKVPDLLRFQQSPQRLVARVDRRGGDHQDHEDACQVLGPPETIGVAAGGGPAAEQKGDGERQGGQCVGRVVHGVAEQCHGAGERGDHRLYDSGRAEHPEGEPQRPQTLGRPLQHGVHLFGGLMAVRGQGMPDPVAQALPRPMVVPAAAVLVPVPVVVFTVVSMTRHGHHRGTSPPLRPPPKNTQ